MTKYLADKPLLMVGSVPGETAEEVFRMVGPVLGNLLAGVGDGEPGYRNKWVVFNAPQVFEPNPGLETLNKPKPRPENSVFKDLPDWVMTSWEDMWKFRVRPGFSELKFRDLPYPEYVRESYPLFVRLRKEGVIPKGARFQVSLPQPEDFVRWCAAGSGDFAVMARGVEDALKRAVGTILKTVPPEDLVLQWDVCWEMLALATGDCLGSEPMAWKAEGDPLERFTGYIKRLCPLVPKETVLGMHLCYGDLEHTHLVEPPDLRDCVRMTNAAVKNAGRPFDFVQMPVPRGRSDDAYFEPLRKLEAPDTKLYIGLVHHTDGVEGTMKRVATFKRHYQGDFGVATECGWGRRKAETIPALMKIHREVAAAITK